MAQNNQSIEFQVSSGNDWNPFDYNNTSFLEMVPSELPNFILTENENNSNPLLNSNNQNVVDRVRTNNVEGNGRMIPTKNFIAIFICLNKLPNNQICLRRWRSDCVYEKDNWRQKCHKCSGTCGNIHADAVFINHIDEEAKSKSQFSLVRTIAREIEEFMKKDCSCWDHYCHTKSLIQNRLSLISK